MARQQKSRQGDPPALIASRALVPLPTQLIPTGQELYFQVQKNPVTSKISVIFAGSAGEGSIKSADIKVTHPDGSVTTGIILPLKGVTEITLDRSKETDRVEIIAKMFSGETYRVYDDLVPFMRYETPPGMLPFLPLKFSLTCERDRIAGRYVVPATNSPPFL